MASASNRESSIPEFVEFNDSISIFQWPRELPNAVVIFLHDINWNQGEKLHEQTWMSRDPPRVYWPKYWLGRHFRKARIVAARYDAAIWKTNSVGHMRLGLIAENLWQDILKVTDVEGCPIFLVGHGFGGLVIKALVYAMSNRISLGNTTRTDELVSCFLKNVQGVVFFSTAFLGTKLADSLKNFPHRTSLLKLQEVLCQEVNFLNHWFSQWRANKKCKAMAISAALPSKVALPTIPMILSALYSGRGFTNVLPMVVMFFQALWLGHTVTHVVEDESIRFDVDEVYTCSASNHFNVCKLRRETDSSFQKLVEFIGSGMQLSTHDLQARTVEAVMHADTTELDREVWSKRRKVEQGHGPYAVLVTEAYSEMISEISEIRGRLSSRVSFLSRFATMACRGYHVLRPSSSSHWVDYGGEILTIVDGSFSLKLVDFSEDGRFSVVPVGVKVTGTTLLRCSVVMDDNRPKLCVSFSNISGVLNGLDFVWGGMGGMDLKSLRTTLYASIKKLGLHHGRDCIVLNPEDECNWPRRRALGDGLVYTLGCPSPVDCMDGSTTLELQGDVRQILERESMTAFGNIGDLRLRSFLELHIRHRLEVSYLRTQLGTGIGPVAAHRVSEIIDLDWDLKFDVGTGIGPVALHRVSEIIDLDCDLKFDVNMYKLYVVC